MFMPTEGHLTPGAKACIAEFAAIIESLCAFLEGLAGGNRLALRLSHLTQGKLRQIVENFAAMAARATAGLLPKPAPRPACATNPATPHRVARRRPSRARQARSSLASPAIGEPPPANDDQSTITPMPRRAQPWPPRAPASYDTRLAPPPAPKNFSKANWPTAFSLVHFVTI